MSVSASSFDKIVAELWRRLEVDFGPLWDVRVMCSVSDWRDDYIIRASRYLTVRPHWSWHAIEYLPGRAVKAHSCSKSALIAVVRDVLERLALALREWFPPTWRKYGRPKRESSNHASRMLWRRSR